jgi:hypothetical protein
MSRPNADSLVADLAAVATPDVPSLRAVRRLYTRAWHDEPGGFILGVALALIRGRFGWIGHELVRFHRGAFSSLTDDKLAALAARLDSWDSVDAFGRILSGPAWAHGLASDSLFQAWAGSPDRWLRRAALVSTIELRDTPKMLAICEHLVDDRDDMVEKALSWTLRERSKRDQAAVRHFLRINESRLAARVKREVGNKLATGLKNPRKS